MSNKPFPSFDTLFAVHYFASRMSARNVLENRGSDAVELKYVGDDRRLQQPGLGEIRVVEREIITPRGKIESKSFLLLKRRYPCRSKFRYELFMPGRKLPSGQRVILAKSKTTR